MSWEFRHGIVGWVLAKILGRASDGLTGGDPLSPDSDGPELEPLDVGTMYPNRRVEGFLPREKFKDLVERLDAGLDKGFRETQKEVLRARAAKLKAEERFVLLCNVYHGDAPTGLQVMVSREEGGMLLILMEGRGPAMEVVKEVFEEQGARPKLERDGSFHFDEESKAWRAYLPGSWGKFLDQDVSVWVEEGWPGMPESGDLGDSLFLQGLIKSVREVLGAADGAFRLFVEEEVIGDVSEPWMIFPAKTVEPDEWYLQVSRSQWEDFRWKIAFKGARAMGITAGG